MEIVLFAAGLLSGITLGWLLMYLRQSRSEKTMLTRIAELETLAREIETNRQADIRIVQNMLDHSKEENVRLSLQLEQTARRYESLTGLYSEANEARKYLQQKLEEQKIEIEKIQQNFRIEFENTANRLFTEHSKVFSESSKKNLGEILDPLKEKIVSFEKQVGDAFKEEMRDKLSLREEVKHLLTLNQKISQEANNLTRALKGDVKKMGNWGEVLLERILEQSGLEKDTMYKTQVSSTTEEGKRLQPDVIVYLPDKKHIVIDAKVSLLAYEKYVNAEMEEDRSLAAKEHLNSLYAHVKGLSAKNYQNNDGINSPDFVLLFIPIESSFSVAIKEDIELFDFAWKNKIVLVSPSTLLATLKTIQSIWKQENQTRNALEIARMGSDLYDKFVGFLEDLQKVGSSIQSSHRSYEEAMKKLSVGRGNILTRIESMRKMGLSPGKSLPPRLSGLDELPLDTSETEL